LKSLLFIAFPIWGAVVFAPVVQTLQAGKVSAAILTLFALFAPVIGGLPIFQSSLVAHLAGLIFFVYDSLSLLAVFIVWVQFLI
jgi:hypothetical protein